MEHHPKQTYSLCPACSACPTVEVHQDGRVTIGELANLVTLEAEQWNQLVRGIRSGVLGEVGPDTRA